MKVIKKILKVLGIIILCFIGLCIIIGITDKPDTTADKEAIKEPEVIEIEYTPITVDELVNVLNDNALKANTLYKDAYLEIEGKLSTIDSDGKYICLYPINDDWTFDNVQCYLDGTKEMLNYVVNLSVGDIIKARVKITDVGEVLSYSANLIEFVD